VPWKVAVPENPPGLPPTVILFGGVALGLLVRLMYNPATVSGKLVPTGGKLVVKLGVAPIASVGAVLCSTPAPFIVTRV